jgi:glycosyl transferase family 25
MRGYVSFIVAMLIIIIGNLVFFYIYNTNLSKKFSDSGLDHVVYINLDSRQDRKIQTENELNKYGIKYERFSAIREKNGALGCTKSHLQCLKNAKNMGYKNVLILEDDIEFIVSPNDFYNEIQKLFQVPFDCCLLAYNTPNLYESKYPFLYRIKDAQTTSGYIVQSHYYDTLIDCWERAVMMLEKTGENEKYTCDQSWKPLQEKDNWYCFKNRIGKQRESYSDIQGGVVDYKV